MNVGDIVMKLKSKHVRYIVAITFLSGLLIAFYYSVNLNNRVDKLLVISIDADYKINYYKYDTSTEQKPTLLGGDFKQHSPGVFHEETNSIYFTKQTENGSFQLYKKAIAAKEEKLICQDISNKLMFADFIDVNPKATMLYLRVIQKGHQNTQLATYDPIKDTINIWDEMEPDFSYRSLNYSYSKNNLIVSKYSLQDQNQRISKAIETQNFNDINPTYEICSLDSNGKELKVLEKINRIISDADLSSNNRYLLTIETNFSKGVQGDMEPYINLKDLSKGTSEVIISNKSGFYNISHARFSSSGKGIYFTAIEGNAEVIGSINGNPFKTSALYFYDLKTKKTKELASFKNVSVDNFEFIY